ncbi:MAG TPA: alpha/beta hydrolase [Streptosporangiaceae bacterium]
MTGPAAGADLVPPEPVSSIWATSRDGARLHVEIHGRPAGAAPAVVLVHGWTCSIPFWAPVIRALRDSFRVIAYDLRGHGLSDHGEAGGSSVRALADDLDAVLDQTVPPGQQAVLAGHSMGGMAIMAAAPRETVLSRVGGALLASTGASNLIADALAVPFGAFIPPFVMLQHWLLTSATPLGPFSQLTRPMLGYLTLGPDAPAELATANADIIQACDRRARGAWGRVLADLDVADGARRLDVPVQVLVGSADRLTPPGHARRLARLLPQLAGLTELPRVGHMTPLEAPGMMSDLIRKLAADTGTPG